MNLMFSFTPSRIIRLGLFLAICLLASSQARAEDLYLVSKLIWGTDKENVSKPSLKPVDAETAKKFSNVFKWKHYYEVSRTNVYVASRTSQQIKMSKQCTIEITELAGPSVEVKLIGEGKPLHKIVKPLSKGEYFTIAGGSKDDSAWFIAIYQVDQKDFKGEIIPKSALPVVSK
ncbi:MAG: hypothetical protein JWM16_4071 [Verrucomicrobiales bacterium]|jgi:hypothetical protein|nr:hypothetical protein [Verrucomicrobiales bacterium]